MYLIYIFAVQIQIVLQTVEQLLKSVNYNTLRFFALNK